MKPSAFAVCAISCLSGNQPLLSPGNCFIQLAPGDQLPVSFKA
jgi:hypothetical protein